MNRFLLVTQLQAILTELQDYFLNKPSNNGSSNPWKSTRFPRLVAECFDGRSKTFYTVFSTGNVTLLNSKAPSSSDWCGISIIANIKQTYAKIHSREAVTLCAIDAHIHVK
jgi:hypothetical protein